MTGAASSETLTLEELGKSGLISSKRPRGIDAMSVRRRVLLEWSGISTAQRPL